MTAQFSNNDFWQAIVLYGLNAATYKMALATVLLQSARAGESELSWGDLSERYLREYLTRLETNPQPQQSNPSRLTKMERVVSDIKAGKETFNTSVVRVADEAFSDVIPRFHTIGRDSDFARDTFYTTQFGKRLTLTDQLLSLADVYQLHTEVSARWSLLEGAFVINQSNYELANSVREIYLADAYDRKPLAPTIPFLEGYQGNACFYCGEALDGDIHVDHVLPRQVLNHDEIWNLVLSHSHCNMLKSDRLVGDHFITKLIARNENIMGSNHPWKAKISDALGTTPRARAKALQYHYDNVKLALGSNFWGGVEGYNPSTDPFYRRLITELNNK